MSIYTDTQELKKLFEAEPVFKAASKKHLDARKKQGFISYEDAKQAYFNNPYSCPYCKSDNIEITDEGGEMTQKWNDVACNACSREWVEIYTLTDFEEK